MLCACETVCVCQRTRALQGDGKRGRMWHISDDQHIHFKILVAWQVESD